MATNETTTPDVGGGADSIGPGVGMAHTTVVPANFDPDESDRRRE